MLKCMFCQNMGNLQFKDDDGTDQPIKKYMLAFFGEDIEDCLRDDDKICNLCAFIIESIAKLKDSLLPHILRTQQIAEHEKPLNINKIWSEIIDLNVEEEDNDARIPTPSLVYYNHAEIYDESVEEQIAIEERKRSLSRLSTATKRSDADSEIAKYNTKGKRKKRRKSRTKFTRTKKSKYSDECVSRSRANSRLTTVSSRSSRKSFVSDYSNHTTAESCYDLSDLDDDFQSTFETDGLEIVRENHIHCHGTAYDEESEYDLIVQKEYKCKFYCDEENCREGYETIDSLTEHLISNHNKLALYWCTLCKNKKYTSRNHLNEHRRNHHKSNFICEICRNEFSTEKAYKEHWQEHVKNSVSCGECGKKFYNEKIRHEHTKREHNNSRNERTPSRINFSENSVQNVLKENNNIVENNNFKVKVLVQSSKQYII